MANNIKIDYTDIFVNIKWDAEKAACLLEDLHSYFECPDLDFPPRNHIEAIRNDFHRIAIKIGLLEDLIDKLDTTAAAVLDLEDAS